MKVGVCLELRGLPEDGTPLIDVSLMDDESEDCLQLEEEEWGG